MSYYELLADESLYSYFEKRKFFVTPAHVHGAVEFLFVEKGSQQVVMDGKEYTINQGQGCFYDSFCIHAYEIDSGAKGFVLLGDREYIENFFKLNGGKVPPRIFNFSDFSLLDNLKTRYDAHFSSIACKQAFFAGVISIVLSTIANQNGLIEPKTEEACPLVLKVLRYAEKNYDSDLSLKFLAKKFGYSREYLSRLLSKYIFEPWGDYVNRIRVRRANELIKSGKTTVIDALFACGFSSPNTFYRAYKKEFGSSPKTK